jgi:hypothetical protein
MVSRYGFGRRLWRVLLYCTTICLDIKEMDKKLGENRM